MCQGSAGVLRVSCARLLASCSENDNVKVLQLKSSKSNTLQGNYKHIRDKNAKHKRRWPTNEGKIWSREMGAGLLGQDVRVGPQVSECHDEI